LIVAWVLVLECVGFRSIARTQADDAKAQAQVQIGEALERAGRLADAEAAFLKAAADGSVETRRVALAALERIVGTREAADSKRWLQLGQKYESEGLLSEAQAAYQKALDGGSPKVQALAYEKIHALSARRAGFVEAYWNPAWGTFVRGLVTVGMAILFVGVFLVVLRPCVNRVGRFRGSASLSLMVSPLPAAQITGTTFADVFSDMHESMKEHFRPRLFVRDRALPYLVRSQSSELADLVSSVDPNAAPFLGWLTKRLHQPAYRVNVAIEGTVRRVNALATLEHRGAQVARWNHVGSTSTWFNDEKDLAYAILIALKEHADAYAHGIEQP
jgi:hypothetical protein